MPTWWYFPWHTSFLCRFPAFCWEKVQHKGFDCTLSALADGSVGVGAYLHGPENPLQSKGRKCLWHTQTNRDNQQTAYLFGVSCCVKWMKYAPLISGQVPWICFIKLWAHLGAKWSMFLYLVEQRPSFRVRNYVNTGNVEAVEGSGGFLSPHIISRK